MASKQLESIIATMPPATVREKIAKFSDPKEVKKIQNSRVVKIVASATEEIKDELKKIAKDVGITESAIILRALKSTFNFQSIDDEMLIDRRTLR